MHSLVLQWHPYRVDVGAFERLLIANDLPNYDAATADEKLTLWFFEKPDAESVELVEELWADMPPDSAVPASHTLDLRVPASCLDAVGSTETQSYTPQPLHPSVHTSFASGQDTLSHSAH